MKQAELALALGISPAAMSDRLRGVKDFDLKELAPLAGALSTSEPYLLGFTDDRSPRPDDRTGAVVRQQGLEPRTRWLRVSPARAHLRLVPSVAAGTRAPNHFVESEHLADVVQLHRSQDLGGVA